MNLTDIVLGHGEGGKDIAGIKNKVHSKESKIKPHKRSNSLINKFMKQNGKCYYCKCDMLLMHEGGAMPPNYATKDHLIPRKFGGKGKPYNIVIACFSCNSSRGHMDSEEFRNQSQPSNNTLKE